MDGRAENKYPLDEWPGKWLISTWMAHLRFDNIPSSEWGSGPYFNVDPAVGLGSHLGVEKSDGSRGVPGILLASSPLPSQICEPRRERVAVDASLECE